jgi:hypothetical protein
MMVSCIQKKFAVKEPRLAEKMYQEDAQNRTENGHIETAGPVEIVDIAKETMKVKASVPVQQVFDFSLNVETK